MLVAGGGEKNRPREKWKGGANSPEKIEKKGGTIAQRGRENSKQPRRRKEKKYTCGPKLDRPTSWSAGGTQKTPEIANRQIIGGV